MLSRVSLFLGLVSCAAAQQASNSAAGTLACPPANQVIRQDPATFTWSKGANASNYRLLVGPTAGSSRDGDTSVVSGLQAQLAGLPAGETLYVTLWSYDQNGNALQPPSYCTIKIAPERAEIGFKDVPETTLSGVSLGSFAAGTAGAGLPLAQAVQACQAQCKQNSACQGYTYYPAGNGNPAAMCDLKSQITASDPSSCCLSALKTVTRAEAPPPPPAAAAPSAPALVSAGSLSAPAPAARPSSAARAAPAPSPQASPSQPAASATASSAGTRAVLTGDWVNQVGAISRIVQKGNAITGTYSDPMVPALTGTIQGTFDGTTLRATLNWKNGRDSSHGTLQLDLTPLGRLEGTWTDAAGVSGLWSMGPAGSTGVR